jgi:hypothetical protein
VIFEDETTEKIKGIGNVGNSPIIKYVLLVDGLKYNLFSIRQLYDRGNEVIFNEVIFESLHYLVIHVIDETIIFI